MKRWLFAVALMALAPAGCGTAAAGLPDACAVVSSSDVAPIVGGPVTQGHGTTQVGGEPVARGCLFRPVGSFTISAPDSNARFLFAQVSFIGGDDYVQWQRYDPTEPVFGLGDRAFLAGDMHLNLLFVAKGPYRLEFEVAAGLADFAAAEEALARVVIPRLTVWQVRLS